MKEIYIFLGQSNAVSTYVEAAGIPPQYANLPRAEIGYSHWSKSGSSIRETGEGVVNSLNTANGWFGPELSCLQRLVDVYGRSNVVGVKVAEGSTDLAIDWADGGTLMTRLRDYVKGVVANYDDEPWKIKGVFRMQGESDSNKPTDAENFEVNLTNHYQALRNDFFESYKGLPIIEGRIKKSPNGVATIATIAQTQDAQATVCDADRNASLVDTSDLAQHTDNVHFTTPSMISLGERFADALINLTTQS